jgi:hypothetical protein
MLNQPTMERLQAMKLHGMAQAFREQYENADASQLTAGSWALWLPATGSGSIKTCC